MKSFLYTAVAASIILVSAVFPSASFAQTATYSFGVGMRIIQLTDEEYIAEVQHTISREPHRIDEIKDLARRSLPHLAQQFDALSPEPMDAEEQELPAAASE